jgi:hypothetical protein
MKPRRPWTLDDALLYALVARAWEAKATDEFPATVGAILEAFDRSPLSWLEACERQRAHVGRLVAVLRETDPGPWWRAAP